MQKELGQTSCVRVIGRASDRQPCWASEVNDLLLRANIWGVGWKWIAQRSVIREQLTVELRRFKTAMMIGDESG